MTINKAYAGTLESSDIFVEIEPAAEGTGIELKLTSAVKQSRLSEGSKSLVNAVNYKVSTLLLS